MQFYKAIIFTAILLSFSSAINMDGANAETVAAATQCRGADCGKAPTAAKTVGDSLAGYRPTPSQLLLAGIGLLGLRIVFKKLVPPKE